MKYKVVGNYSPLDSLVDNVLKQRGIQNKEALLSARTEDCLIDFRRLRNIDRGVDLISTAIEQNYTISIIQDSDNDGVMSTVLLYKWLKMAKIPNKIHILFHEGKQHGLSKDIKLPSDTKLLLIPDAGTNNCSELEELINKGIDVLVLDHHIKEERWRETGAIIINNQMSPDYPNKSNAGAGITLQFVRALDERFGTNYANDLVEFAGFGNIGDNMDSRCLETRALINYCTDFENIKNPMLKRLVETKIFKSGGKLNGSSIAWNIVPLINATCRFGTQAEKYTVFEGFISEDEEVIDKAIKTATSCKSRQDNNKKKAIKLVQEYIEENGLTKYPFIVVNTRNLFEDNELNGVVCNTISETYHRPVLLGGANEDEIMKGSARNCSDSFIKSLKEELLSSGLVESAEGHDNAFGFKIKTSNITKLMEYSLKYKDKVQKDKIYYVDAEFNLSDIGKKEVIEVGELENLFVTTIKEPLFAIKNIKINNSKIERYGSRSNVLRFQAGGFTFFKMFLSNDFYERVSMKNKETFGSIDVDMTAIVKMKYNDWNGERYPQFELVDAESIKDNKKEEILF